MRKPGKLGGGIGQYVLGKTIGEGTFGKVRLGTHVLTGETVAVKILERLRVKEIADVERVAREIHILKRVQHSHIIQLHEIIETPDQLFLIMEYCSGGELFDHIVECTRLPEPDACRFFQQILSGVEQIHRINVVHRDLKPENLLLDKDKNIKIVDFGLSNIYKDGQLLKTACGSPCYASPEMIAGQWYEPSRCDVWSCGVILFALVCGYLPFEDGNTAALYRKILNADYRTPKFISPAVKELIGKMLTTDPEKRITIDEIRQHEWYQQVPDLAAAVAANSAQTDELDQEILEKLVDFGFPKDFAVESVKRKKHNNATTTYQLLLEKKNRGQEQACSDVNSVISSCDDDSADVFPPVGKSSDNETPATGDGQAHRTDRKKLKRARKKQSLREAEADCNGKPDAPAGAKGAGAGYSEKLTDRQRENLERNQASRQRKGGGRGKAHQKGGYPTGPAAAVA